MTQELTWGIQTIPVTPIQQNCRIFFNKATKSCFVVDPGGNSDYIQKVINSLAQELGLDSLKVEAIVLTHGHFDHIGGVTYLRDLLGKDIPVLGPFAQDEIFFNNVRKRAQEFGLNTNDFADFEQNASLGDRFFTEHEKLNLCGFEFRVEFTPGHSPGHAILVCDQEHFAFVGDLIFRGSVGRTDLTGSSFSALEESIRNYIYTLEDDFILLPGHGPNTEVAYEKHNNPYVSL